MRNFSQNNEQEIILDYFGDFKGRFLDIGAYNGVDLSNTRALLELGWTGVMVEPNPFNLVDLINNCRPFSERVSIISAGIGNWTGVKQLRIDDSPGRGWAASFVPDKDGISLPCPVIVNVPLLPISVCYEAGYFEMISIDAEYMDLDILTSFDLDPLKNCRLLVIEAVERDMTRAYLESVGFKIHAETPENIIAAR